MVIRTVRGSSKSSMLTLSAIDPCMGVTFVRFPRWIFFLLLESEESSIVSSPWPAVF